jgi:hypothetical protein
MTAPRNARPGRGGAGSGPTNGASSVGSADAWARRDRRRATQRPTSTRKYTPTMAITATADGRSRPATTAQRPAQTGRRRIRQNNVPAAAAVNSPSG